MSGPFSNHLASTSAYAAFAKCERANIEREQQLLTVHHGNGLRKKPPASSDGAKTNQSCEVHFNIWLTPAHVETVNNTRETNFGGLINEILAVKLI